MLKKAREKVEKKIGEVSMRADTIERRAEDPEAALRKAVEENSRLFRKIKELKVHLGVEEKRTAKAATSQAVEDFQAFEKYEEERAEYSTDTYNARRQSIRARVAAKYSSLDLNFFDKF